ncbi:MAG: PrsW family intramembrane metalloprotease, partial [Brachybacterium sp.]|nr:PrsW family intramembrane metalloprotease [Brachybacterium sp.]
VSAWAAQQQRVQQVQAAPPFPWRTVITWAVAGLLIIGLLLMLLLLFAMTMQLDAASLAVFPVIVVLAGMSLLVIAAVMALADRWDPQPLPLMLIAVLWGAVVAAFTSLVVNTMAGVFAYVLTGSQATADAVGAVLSAPLAEEITKGFGLVLLLLLARRHFTGPLDGLIYGALIGGGFAFTENILYYGGAFATEGAFGTGFMVFMRGVLGIFGHPIYTSLTGVVIGLVARHWGTWPGALSYLIAVWPGIILHALWNGTLVFSPPDLAGLMMIALYGGQFILTVLWLALLIVLMFDESRRTRRLLGDYAQYGWLTHEEVQMLATWRGRREGRRWARAIGASPVMRRFIREASDLASLRQQVLAEGMNPRRYGKERDLLGRLSSRRQALLTASQPR